MRNQGFILNNTTSESYDVAKESFDSESWMNKVEDIEFLTLLINNYPTKFEDCEIIKVV